MFHLQYLNAIRIEILENLRQVASSPSVQMQSILDSFFEEEVYR